MSRYLPYFSDPSPLQHAFGFPSMLWTSPAGTCFEGRIGVKVLVWLLPF